MPGVPERPARVAGLAGDGNRIVASGRQLTWRELRTADLPSPVAVLAATGLDALAAARQHAVQGTELVLSTPSRVDSELRDELADAGFTVVRLDDGDVTVVEKGRQRAADPERLWLLTSGSTGRPKRVGHTLDSLTTVRGTQEPRTWLCPYSPGTYAWWQVVTLSLTQPGQDLVVIEPSELDIWAQIASEHGVTAASGTPTFWRQAIHRDGEALARVPLRQITLGGEPVDQAILDQLRQIFPAARISWIYASSELGASIVVHDGRAGFPQEWLDRSAPDRPSISVDGDELVIRSPYHGVGLTGAVRTGDRVEIIDGRVHIVGRLNSDEINVGGSKISAGLVRHVLTSHPQVAWARVTSRKAPIVGRMVAAEVVLAPAADRAEVDETALVKWCGDRLPDYGVPRRIRFLEEIPVKETLKSDV
ncbi:AMP-binding protein [Actinoplanes sp. KI2]|uniref:AMP-binding protein n=1 Tax=Actinoplanes sp. KI2 TaxID=2983315 RepID=UPI0021D5AFE8|nr:AMP-binding protein [Actinoplanes sp. KI2]MCU7729748.1 AMP-binding protein [Actinoplanes sp. KI2]